MDFAIKWGNQIINFARYYFICLKMFIMQQRKNRVEKR